MKSNISRILLCVATCVTTMAVPAFAESSELPTLGLENRIEFWTKVYTQYGGDDIIIHDRYNVNLIYDIATTANVDAKKLAVREALSEIRSQLDSPENLSPNAQLIASQIMAEGLPVSAKTIGVLEDRIHTQRGIKERFRDGVVRSGRYLETFQDIFKNAGLPTELALLPLVESSFTNARSSVGAVGIWQFMQSTGKLYLTVTNKVDERQDPLKATIAASRLLKDNYRALGVWPLAITAYNHGRGGMQRAQSAHGSHLPTIIEKYDGASFGYASMNFYAEFIAAVQVYNSYPQYFGQLVLDRPDSPAPQNAPQKATVQVAAVKAPAAKAPAAKAPAPKAAVAARYKVRTGDTLWDIAQRFGTSIRELMDKNSLKKPAIYAGQMLLVK